MAIRCSASNVEETRPLITSLPKLYAQEQNQRGRKEKDKLEVKRDELLKTFGLSSPAEPADTFGNCIEEVSEVEKVSSWLPRGC
jgi:hypothetical protein